MSENSKETYKKTDVLGVGVERLVMPGYKPQVGIWTLVAPDGRKWEADSPIHCCRDEQKERVPPQVAIERLAEALADTDKELACEIAQEILNNYGVLAHDGNMLNGEHYWVITKEELAECFQCML